MTEPHTKKNTSYEDWLKMWIKDYGVVDLHQSKHWYNIGFSAEDMKDSATKKKEAMTSQCQRRYH